MQTCASQACAAHSSWDVLHKIQMREIGYMSGILQIDSPEEKRKIARDILEALPEWFGILESRECYIGESAGQLFLRAEHEGKPVGFLCLKETGRATVELAVMGVLKEFHRRGIGRALVCAAKERAAKMGYSLDRKSTRLNSSHAILQK